MKKNNKGFTLAELLIVVAIIAVLVAIAIPIFTNQLENSREAVDASNIRAAYAEIAAAALTDPDTAQTATIQKKQTVPDWQNTGIKDIAGVTITKINSNTATTVAYAPNATSGIGEITIDGEKVTSTFITPSSSAGGTTP